MYGIHSKQQHHFFKDAYRTYFCVTLHNGIGSAGYFTKHRRFAGMTLSMNFDLRPYVRHRLFVASITSQIKVKLLVNIRAGDE